MQRTAKYLIAVIASVGIWGPAAPALGQPAPDEPLSDEDLAAIADGEAIEIFAERPDKPFDRDTEVRLTGEELAQRGAVDLATALALLPDVSVRDGGRGGYQIDIRGARKGAVTILIDGILVTDPWYGTFDVSTIPITDIVQIRVSTTPQSPIDGPGGPGGVIEVHTRDAIGEQLVIARLTADSLPSFGITGTARVALAKHLALRLSGSGQGGARDLELPGNASIGEARHASTGSGRLEYRKGDRRIVADGFLDDRHYISPPSDTNMSSILMIDRETSARGAIKADEKIGTLQLQGQYFVSYLHRRARFFRDPAFQEQQQVENLSAIRSGGGVLATRPINKELRWATSASVSHEKALVFNMASEFARGDVTMLEIAADGQYEKEKVRVDAAVGLAMPFGVGADPWPEGKLVGKFKPRQPTEITLTTGYKGRVPSLRERFDLATGNPALGPEKALHLELRATETRDWLRLEIAPFYRHTTGTARVSTDPADNGRLVNLGKLDIYGIDVQGRGKVHKMVEVGASYNYVKASSDEVGDDPLDRLPHNRFDVFARFTPTAAINGLVRLKYYGESIDRMNTVEGYALLEGSVSWQISKEYLGVLRVDDALNVRPETRAGYHTAGRVIYLVLTGSWQ